MNFQILTLFPDMFRGFVNESILKRGQESGAISIETIDIRDYSTNKHKKVDDSIFGGGAGMLLKPEPVAAAIRAAKEKKPHAKVIYLSPGGELLTQEKAENLANAQDDLILLCGRYEGVDQRIRAMMIDEEISIGEYVLSGGEIAAAAVVDTVSRLVPGVVGKQESVVTESFSTDIFRSAEFPQFTRPEVWEGLAVPRVLLSGNHAQIKDWQLSHLPGLTETEEKILFLRRKVLPRKTQNLLLRNHIREDIDAWVSWFNDREVMQYLQLSPPLTREDEEEYFVSSQQNLFKLSVSICDKKTQKAIGNMSVEIDPNMPNFAEFGIVIGEKQYWNTGICHESTREMFVIIFQELNISRIRLEVFSKNIAAQKCYEKVGMHRTGEQKGKYEKDGIFHDVFFYEILREEFLSRNT